MNLRPNSNMKKGSTCGPDCFDRQIQEKAQIQSARLSPLSGLRAAAGVLPEIRPLPDLFSEPGLAGGNSRGYQVELVKEFFQGGNHGDDGSLGRYAHASA